MADDRTSMNQLLDVLWAERYGYPFNQWVADRRGRGAKWRQIAREVEDMTGVEIPHTTLTRWFPELRGDAVVAA